jgi:hypothetical protein
MNNFIKVPTLEDFKATPRELAIMRMLWAAHEAAQHSNFIHGVPYELQEEKTREEE